MFSSIFSALQIYKIATFFCQLYLDMTFCYLSIYGQINTWLDLEKMLAFDLLTLANDSFVMRIKTELLLTCF